MNARDLRQALAWAWCLSSLACAADPLTSSSWRQTTFDLVATFREASRLATGGYLRVGSRVECVLGCQRYSHCTAVAFDRGSGDCYLQPDLGNNQTQSAAHLGEVWVNTDPVCQIDDAPASNGTVAWDHTLTSLRGTVTCHPQFMRTANDVSVTCTTEGSWLREGACVRHIWTNPTQSTFYEAVPFPVTNGWTLCIEGVPTQDRQFFVNLHGADGDMPLHADFRKATRWDTDTVLTNYRLNGTFNLALEQRDVLDPYPFVVGTPFRIKFKATASNDFEIYIDAVLRVAVPQHPSVPASNITAVEIALDVNVTRVDVWCLP